MVASPRKRRVPVGRASNQRIYANMSRPQFRSSCEPNTCASFRSGYPCHRPKTNRSPSKCSRASSGHQARSANRCSRSSTYRFYRSTAKACDCYSASSDKQHTRHRYPTATTSRQTAHINYSSSSFNECSSFPASGPRKASYATSTFSSYGFFSRAGPCCGWRDEGEVTGNEINNGRFDICKSLCATS